MSVSSESFTPEDIEIIPHLDLNMQLYSSHEIYGLHKVVVADCNI